ncbi:hypothetical protein QYM36_016629 [Artemia franciscana]|uniref:Reverse transcriptase domain-containing protein n=1 Tax=Artemia franciscana TaxID=6661 RepID=A0AA88HF48_ARTSF|nr:hypothetical protein QYM36_016629 [Artemia franciscana]
MEGILRDGIIEHVLENKLINPSQFGFLPRKGTMTALLEALNDWTEALESGKSVLTVFFDVEKAFDSVPRSELLNQLKIFNLAPSITTWIEDLLKSQSQQTRINGIFSEQSHIESSAIQGSTLGPTLFLLHINSATTGLSSPHKSMQRTQKIYCMYNSQDYVDILQRDINIFTSNLSNLDLKLNIMSCKVMWIGSPKDSCPPRLMIQDKLG